MAKIILEPNETFEHFHSEDSTTILIEGRGHYRAGNNEFALQHDNPVLTPANQSHSITNIGEMKCMFECRH